MGRKRAEKEKYTPTSLMAGRERRFTFVQWVESPQLGVVLKKLGKGELNKSSRRR